MLPRHGTSYAIPLRSDPSHVRTKLIHYCLSIPSVPRPPTIQSSLLFPSLLFPYISSAISSCSSSSIRPPLPLPSLTASPPLRRQLVQPL
eukprot:758764-Hanusia_phi.AAC.2